MLEFKIRKTIVKLDFTFFAAIVILFAINNRSFGIAALAACGIHELSHIIVMMLTGINPDTVIFYGGGIKISSVQIEKASVWKRVLVLSAGCIANFITALWYWLNGNAVLAMINLFTGIYNLLPFGELDGAALLKMLIIAICRAEKVDRVIRIIRITLGLVLVVVAFCVGGMMVIKMIDSYDIYL